MHRAMNYDGDLIWSKGKEADICLLAFITYWTTDKLTSYWPFGYRLVGFCPIDFAPLFSILIHIIGYQTPLKYLGMNNSPYNRNRVVLDAGYLTEQQINFQNTPNRMNQIRRQNWFWRTRTFPRQLPGTAITASTWTTRSTTGRRFRRSRRSSRRRRRIKWWHSPCIHQRHSRWIKWCRSRCTQQRYSQRITPRRSQRTTWRQSRCICHRHSRRIHRQPIRRRSHCTRQRHRRRTM